MQITRVDGIAPLLRLPQARAVDMFEGPPELQDGQLVLSERPGHGLSLNEAYIAQHLAR